MQRRRTTKELIADSFLEISATKDIDKITIKNIVENCGLTATTFYNHFYDKYDLAVWIYSTSVEKIMNRIGRDGYQWQDTLTDGVNYAVENRRFLLNAITHMSGYDSFISNMTKINLRLFLENICRRNELHTAPREVEILSKIYVYGTVCMLCEWLIGSEKEQSEPDELVRLFEAALPESLKKYLYKNG